MNYFAHARPFLDNPYFVAGTAVPDWLSVLDRKMRVRSTAAQTLASHTDGRVAALAAGIVQHHHDDGWFHQTRAFAELNLQLTAAVREVLPQDDGFRPSFLGHILVEILLDAALIAAAPDQLDAYYEALNSVDPQLVGEVVNQMATRPSDLWPVFIPHFCRAVLVRLPGGCETSRSAEPRDAASPVAAAAGRVPDRPAGRPTRCGPRREELLTAP